VGRAALASVTLGTLGALGALGASLLSACVPTPFSFEETSGAGGAATTSSQSSSTVVGSSTTSSASGSGGSPPTCIPGFECADMLPDGWTDHALVYVSPAGGPGPTCPNGDKPEKLFADPTGAPHTCSMCDCSLAGAACSAPAITCYHLSSACSSADTFTFQASNNQCVVDDKAPVAEDQPGSCKLTGDPIPVAMGSCMTTGGSPIAPDDWGLDVHACPAIKDTSCAGGGTCIESAPADAAICIWRLGTDPCPPAWPNPIQAYASAEETRGCTSCTCGPTTCTGGHYTAIDDLACDPASVNKVTINSTNCTAANMIFDGATASLQPVTAAVNPVACSGGAPTGEFTPQDPRIFCCK
jgi:hypothetical protein